MSELINLPYLKTSQEDADGPLTDFDLYAGFCDSEILVFSFWLDVSYDDRYCEQAAVLMNIYAYIHSERMRLQVQHKPDVWLYKYATT